MAKEQSPIKTVEAKAEIVSSILNSIEEFRTFEPVAKDDTNTCRERIQAVFDNCRYNGRVPTVELLCLALGRSRQTLIDWQRDEKCENGKIVTMAKNTINAMLTELAVTGAVNPVYVMFSQKCNYGYVEPKQEVAVEVKSQNTITPIPFEQIAAEFGMLDSSDFDYSEDAELKLPPLPNEIIESEE